MSLRAYIGAEVFDGINLIRERAVLLDGEIYRGTVDAGNVPEGHSVVRLDGGTILPGFVDLQVNGGGGLMFNDMTTPEGLVTIAAAHASAGTRAFLPTLITDTPQRMRDAVAAVEVAIARDVPGILGLHLEGPHLSQARKGAHDPALIRPMTDADEDFLTDAARRLPNLMVTVAPESVTPDRIRRLATAGVIVSLGHTDCSYDAAQEAFSAGARCVTHLFNAMSQMGSRSPGLVGATLANPGVSAGLIADTVHVHAATMAVALAAKPSRGGIFLVTDSMATAGSDITSFLLNGRRVQQQEGQLTLADGTLAGAALDMPRALSVLMSKLGIAKQTALAMATSWPVGVLTKHSGYGVFSVGTPWNGIYLDCEGRYRALSD